MLKFGISDLLELSGETEFKGLWGGGKKVSVTLYDKLDNHPNRAVIEERILLFFADELGAYKRTYGARFVDFDREVVRQMEAHFPRSETVSVEDVAVSNARTSYDFFVLVSKIFPKIHLNATDYDPYVYLVEKGRIRLTFSSNGKLLEIVCPPFVFNEIKRDSYLYFFNHLVRAVVKRVFVKSLSVAYKSRKKSSHRIALFCQEALALAAKDERFTLGQHNLLKKIESNCNIDVIRAMNILNPEYFHIEQLRIVLINMFDALREGGLFVIGSNSGAGTVVNGAIFQKLGEKFRVLKLTGDGPSRQILETMKNFTR